MKSLERSTSMGGMEKKGSHSRGLLVSRGREFLEKGRISRKVGIIKGGELRSRRSKFRPEVVV